MKNQDWIKFTIEEIDQKGEKLDYKSVLELYNKIRSLVLESSSSTIFKSYLLNDKEIDDNIKEKFYKECGQTAFENSNGDTISIEFVRWHDRMMYSRYGLYEYPSFTASISVNNQIIWGLKRNNTYGQAVSNKEIPMDLLKHKTVQGEDTDIKVLKKLNDDENR